MALNRKLLLLVGVAVVLPQVAFAGGREVVSPYVHGGEWEAEAKSVYVIDNDDDVDGTFEQAFEVGYGITDRVKLAAGVEFEKEPNEDTETKAVELEAKVQLTEKDAYYVDSGLKFVYEYSTTGDNDEIKAELLLAKSYGDFSHGANIEVGTEIGDDT